MPEPVEARPEPPWRERLGRRIAQVTALTSPLVFLPILLGTKDPSTRLELVLAATILAVSIALLARRATPASVRGVGIIAVFLGIGVAGAATVGPMAAPGIAFALGVAVAGLLFGRRGLILAALAAALLMSLAGVLMTSGALPAPSSDDISPALRRPWLRSSAIALLLIVALGAVVTWVVETIESALRHSAEQAERRRQAEQHLFRSQKRELMIRLAGGLAHDVNNQLTVISTWATLLARAGTNEDREAGRSAIATAVDTAGALTRQLLVLGRQDVQTRRSLSLGALVTDYSDTLRGFLPDDIEIRTEIDEETWCRADEAQLHSVLLNLAVNARDAMPQGGTLTIRATRRTTEIETLGANGPIAAGSWSILSVEDSGAGMDDETRLRAFDPFFTTKTAGKGTGLGLATIAAIAEQSGGDVLLHSEPGAGTRVEVWLPSVPQSDDSQQPKPRARADLAGVRVLLAEDTERLLAAARDALIEAGCSVVVAGDGDEAMTRVGETDFDLLLSDVVMPGVPTSTVIDAYLERNPTGRVLLCSGYVGEELVRRGIEQGRYDFLQKPYDLTNLLDAVARTVADPATAAASPANPR